ncbi:uncharacterized mitochondrial protein AtMg00860-like [Megalobrama amblycephala]|uniref:uncharacterized mitochondrial protein AtMg00860-like n=1 Tax=Megalobrama amblycephala TaxID=75352 RepID=UPI002013CDC1|nr:uncharacterized mitochondrial protein AtMg00860-like [Megalobrama amblycephala]
MADHHQHVTQVIQKLKEYLYLKLEKCDFHKSTISFLGYVISEQGIEMDQGKVKAIQNWPIPTTVKELQKFLALANFYRRFIANYSKISSPLTSLLKDRPKSLSWDPYTTEAFQSLKNAFCTAPILVHPDPKLPFIVEMDASTTGVGQC